MLAASGTMCLTNANGVIIFTGLLLSCQRAVPAAANTVPNFSCDKLGTAEPGVTEEASRGFPYTYTVYLSPCYEADIEHEYPILYLLPGRGLGPSSWFAAGANEVAGDMILGDKVHPFLIVATKETGTDMSLAALNPSALTVDSSDPEVGGRGIAGDGGGLIWLQDFAQEGQPIDIVRAGQTMREGVELAVNGLAGDPFSIRPYNTLTGEYLVSFGLECAAEQPCMFGVPPFQGDIALKIERV